MMSFSDSLFVLATILIGAEVFNVFYKTAKRLYNVDVAEVIMFDSRTFICNQSRNKKLCGNESCYFHNTKRIVNYLESAEVCMDVSMYMLNHDEFSGAIGKAHQRGVIVRVIIDAKMAFQSKSKIPWIQSLGVPVKSNVTTVIMHHKFCVIDSPARVAELHKSRVIIKVRKSDEALYPHGLLLNGSMNWTNQATNGNWDNIYIFSNPELVGVFHKEFHGLWEDFNLVG